MRQVLDVAQLLLQRESPVYAPSPEGFPNGGAHDVAQQGVAQVSMVGEQRKPKEHCPDG